MVSSGTAILYLITLIFCIQNGEAEAEPVLFVTPSSAIASEEAAPKQKRDVDVIFVTPFSAPKGDYANVAEGKSPRKSRRSPKKPPPPATSYGTPYHDYYDLPPSKYGPPEDEEDEEEETTTTTTEAPETAPPPEEPHDFKGYDYAPPDDEEQKVIVNKDVYFYKPGPDFTEPPPTPRPIKLPPPRKNYKVIFVKAPTFPSPPQIVPVVPRVEDKTLLYVLVKRPEAPPEVQVPTPAPTKPAPPEVYYVKYETKKEEAKPPPKAYGPPPPPPKAGDKAKRKAKRSRRTSRSSDVRGFVPYVQRRRAYE